MKPRLIIAMLIIFLLVSCGSSRDRNAPAPTAPANTQEVSTDVGLADTRSGDIIESLYRKIVEKSPELSKLENEISDAENAKNDSLSGFHNFNNSNNGYYSNAAEHIDGIKDSTIKQEIKVMLEQSQAAYAGKIAPLKSLESLIDTRAEKLDDLHVMLKLIKTMAAMSEYQNSNIPSAAPLQHALARYDAVIQKVIPLSKK